MERVPKLKEEAEVLQAKLGEINEKMEKLKEEHDSTYKELLEKKDKILEILIKNKGEMI